MGRSSQQDGVTCVARDGIDAFLPEGDRFGQVIFDEEALHMALAVTSSVGEYRGQRSAVPHAPDGVCGEESGQFERRDHVVHERR